MSREGRVTFAAVQYDKEIAEYKAKLIRETIPSRLFRDLPQKAQRTYNNLSLTDMGKITKLSVR